MKQSEKWPGKFPLENVISLGTDAACISTGNHATSSSQIPFGKIISEMHCSRAIFFELHARSSNLAPFFWTWQLSLFFFFCSWVSMFTLLLPIGPVYRVIYLIHLTVMFGQFMQHGLSTAAAAVRVRESTSHSFLRSARLLIHASVSL